jgi:WD40 repeat protein
VGPTGAAGPGGGNDDDDDIKENPDLRDTHRLLSWSADGTLKVWGMSSGKVHHTLTGHGGAITHVRGAMRAVIHCCST